MKFLAGDNSETIAQVSDLKVQLDNGLKNVKTAEERIQQIDAKSSVIEEELRKFNLEKSIILFFEFKKSDGFRWSSKRAQPGDPICGN